MDNARHSDFAFKHCMPQKIEVNKLVFILL